MVIKMTAQNNGQQDFPAVRFVFIFINTSLSEQCYNPCDFHRKNLKRYSARHNIKPYLTGCLRFSYRRCDYSDNYRKRTDTAGYVRYADKLKQSGITASVNRILNSLVKSVTGCGKQHTTRPYTSSIRLLSPHCCVCFRVRIQNAM